MGTREAIERLIMFAIIDICIHLPLIALDIVCTPRRIAAVWTILVAVYIVCHKKPIEEWMQKKLTNQK